jgi:hypothetical protein
MVVTATMNCKKEGDGLRRTFKEAGTRFEDLSVEFSKIPDWKALAAELDIVDEGIGIIGDNLTLIRRARELGEELKVARPRVTVDEIHEEQEKVSIALLFVDKAETAQHLATQFAELTKQVALDPTDITSAQSQILDARVKIDAAEKANDLYTRLLVADAEHEASDEACADSRTECELLNIEYTEACREQGVCTECGGLLSHEECGA